MSRFSKVFRKFFRSIAYISNQKDQSFWKVFRKFFGKFFRLIGYISNQKDQSFSKVFWKVFGKFFGKFLESFWKVFPKYQPPNFRKPQPQV